MDPAPAPRIPEKSFTFLRAKGDHGWALAASARGRALGPVQPRVAPIPALMKDAST